MCKVLPHKLQAWLCAIRNARSSCRSPIVCHKDGMHTHTQTHTKVGSFVVTLPVFTLKILILFKSSINTYLRTKRSRNAVSAIITLCHSQHRKSFYVFGKARLRTNPFSRTKLRTLRFPLFLKRAFRINLST